MKRDSVRAALLSGLVFPGLGQIFLKRYRRGIVMLLITLACLAVIVMRAVQKALVILDRIQSEGGEIGMSAIADAARRASAASPDRLLTLAVTVLILCWILATIDAYRIGKRTEARAVGE